MNIVVIRKNSQMCNMWIKPFDSISLSLIWHMIKFDYKLACVDMCVGFDSICEMQIFKVDMFVFSSVIVIKIGIKVIIRGL